MNICVETRSMGHYDLIVAGGGLAGCFAAVSAAQEGGKVLLVESSGCLGGTLSTGYVPSIMDEKGKGGMLGQLFDFLNQRGMTVARFGKKVDENGKKIPGRIVDIEGCKYFLDSLVRNAGVTVVFFSRVAACEMDGRHVKRVLLCTEAGNYDATAEYFIDATGNGNLAALAGCSFEWGEPGTGRLSPATSGFSVVGFPDEYDGTNSGAEKREYSNMLKEYGINISTEEAGIVRLPAMKLWDMSIDYQYNVLPDNIQVMSEAAINSRQEIFETMEKHRRIPGYEGLWVAQTAEHLGLREGRRVFGKYRITEQDMLEGTHHPDGICLVRTNVDLHKIHPTDSIDADRGFRTVPYEIPFRSLIPLDADNLLLAGRCLSGDFYPHASYRMIGNMAATGEAAGFAVMYALRHSVTPEEVPGDVLRERMREYL